MVSYDCDRDSVLFTYAQFKKYGQIGFLLKVFRDLFRQNIAYHHSEQKNYFKNRNATRLLIQI